jgi:hypothetical protein
MGRPFGLAFCPPFDVDSAGFLEVFDGAVADIMDDVVARLTATEAFDPAGVGWGAKLEVLFPEAAGPAAAAEYLGSTEATIADLDFMVRDGRYALTLAVRDPDPRSRGLALSQLESIARNALSNVPLGGSCQPFFCRLKEDAAADSSLPEGRRRLVGSFRYAIEDDSARDESDDS